MRPRNDHRPMPVDRGGAPAATGRRARQADPGGAALQPQRREDRAQRHREQAPVHDRASAHRRDLLVRRPWDRRGQGLGLRLGRVAGWLGRLAARGDRFEPGARMTAPPDRPGGPVDRRPRAARAPAGDAGTAACVGAGAGPDTGAPAAAGSPALAVAPVAEVLPATVGVPVAEVLPATVGMPATVGVPATAALPGAVPRPATPVGGATVARAEPAPGVVAGPAAAGLRCRAPVPCSAARDPGSRAPKPGTLSGNAPGGATSATATRTR